MVSSIFCNFFLETKILIQLRLRQFLLDINQIRNRGDNLKKLCFSHHATNVILYRADGYFKAGKRQVITFDPRCFIVSFPTRTKLHWEESSQSWQSYGLVVDDESTTTVRVRIS